MTICDIQSEGQSFRRSGFQKENKNLILLDLTKNILEENGDDMAYFYVITTVHKADDGHFIQYGSAPNFQGGVITLCTCKHWMRATRSIEKWTDHVWVAGFSGFSHTGEQALVYLMQVGEAFESYVQLWHESRILTEPARQEKLVQYNKYGDLYQPTGQALPFDSVNYIPPHSDHVHAADSYWYRDVDLRYNKPSALLVGNPEKSFLWDKPLILMRDMAIGRNHRRKNIRALFDHLEGA